MASVFHFFDNDSQELTVPQRRFIYLLLTFKHLNPPLFKKIMVEFNDIASTSWVEDYYGCKHIWFETFNPLKINGQLTIGIIGVFRSFLTTCTFYDSAKFTDEEHCYIRHLIVVLVTKGRDYFKDVKYPCSTMNLHAFCEIIKELMNE